MMADAKKKKGPGFYLDIAAAVLGLIGLAAMAASSAMTVTNRLNGLPALAAMAVTAILLAAVAAVAPTRLGNFDWLSTLSMVVSIILLTVVAGRLLNDRILLISGLFSYNSANTAGWQVLYVTVTAAVCFLLAVAALIVGAFKRSIR